MALFDFFKPQWKHSNPELRAAALRALEDDRQDVFLFVTLEDSDAALRLMASKRLNQETVLRQALDKSLDKGVQEYARRALNLLLTEKIKSAESSELASAKALLNELKADTKAIEVIATGAKLPELRREALGLLTHASSLLTIALEEEVTDIALSALARLSRDTHLQSVAKSAKSKEARANAKARLKAIEEAKKPDAMAIHRAKLQLIFAVAEKADAGSAELNPAFDWDGVREQVEHAEEALQNLIDFGVSVDNRAASLFEDRVTAFRKRYVHHKSSEIARTERELHEGKNKEIKLELCGRMELLFADSKEVDPAEVHSLTQQFNSAGPCPEDEVLRNRFRLAKERVNKEKLQKQYEIQDAERRKVEGEIRQADEAEDQKRREAMQQRVENWRKNIPVMKEWLAELGTLAEGSDLKLAEKRLREVQSKWKNMLANAPDDEATSLNLEYYRAVDHMREVLDWHRWSNQQRKQDICTQLEALVQQEDRKSMVARFRELLAEWKTIGQVPWDSTEAMWDRYHQACDALYEKCKEYFAELDEERESNAKAKEDICNKLEAAMASVTTGEIDWRDVTETFREAQSAWKALGPAPREKNSTLWDRFRAVCQVFYGRKDQQYQENLKQKLELATLVEGLKDSTQWKNTATTIKEAQEKWKSIGPVSRDQAEALWQRFHGASETFFQARKAFFEKLDQDRPANLEKKTALCELVEKLDTLADDEQRYQCIVDVQAQWKEIGPVVREQEDAIWERFRKPIDAYFQERKQHMQAERGQRDENGKIKEDLCIEAEALKDSTDWKASIDKIKALQARWKATGPTFRELDQTLWRRFRGACDGFFDRLKEYSSQRDQERGGNLRKKEDICFTIEILSGAAVEGEDVVIRATWIEGQRALGASIPVPMEDWDKAMDRVKHFQGEWKKIGPVPRENNDVVWDRFQRACDVFFEERRRAMGLSTDDPQHNLEGKLALISEADELAMNPGPHNLETVRKMFQEWKRIGPVPRAQSDYVWERFSSACDTAVGKTA